MDVLRPFGELRTLSVDLDERVATVTLRRPDQLNSFDAEQHREFVELWRALAATRSVRAVVLAAEGPVFSAGGDFSILESAHASVQERLRVTRDGHDLLTALLDVPQPVVVALHGPAVGLGATVVLACDAVVAARSATLADPHVNIGLVAGDGGCVVWPAAVGPLRAKRHLLTGDPLPAEEAHRLGLVTDLVAEPAEALPAALELARRIADLPPLAVQLTKRTVNQGLRQRCAEVLELGLAYEMATLASDDLLEAVDAFRSRRPGVYEGA